MKRRPPNYMKMEKYKSERDKALEELSEAKAINSRVMAINCLTVFVLLSVIAMDLFL